MFIQTNTCTEILQGYQTLVGDGGLQLSVEQRQQIAFARALIRNPQILLVDEATKGLDPKSEEVVQKILQNVAKGRTTIIVPHRLSTIRYADTIYVMQVSYFQAENTKQEVINQYSHIFFNVLRKENQWNGEHMMS